MQILPSVTVELFDYWLRNGFFGEYGFPRSLTLNDIEGQLAIANDEHWQAWRVRISLRKYHALYKLQERQGETYKTIGEIQIEQLEVDRLRVHFWEAEGSGFAARFADWLERVYKGSEPVSRPADSDRGYWTEVHTQAKASGNIRQYLADRDIPPRTYYDNKKRYGL